MNTQTQSPANNKMPMVWYKVPIMWLMVGLLGFTVISGIYLFILAHDTKDTIVLENEFTPLSKKLALPENIIPSKPNTD